MRRDNFTLPLGLLDELIIDNFAGGGGTSTGLEQAFGRPVDIAIADIGLRMLTPRELFTAQGFPASYIIDHGIDENGQRIGLTKTAQVRMCGNSVCPPLSRAIVEANFRHEAAWHQEPERATA